MDDSIFHQLGDWQPCSPTFRDPFKKQEDNAVLNLSSSLTSYSPFEEEEDPSTESSSSSSFLSPSTLSLSGTKTSTPAGTVCSEEYETLDACSLTETPPWDKRRKSLNEDCHGQITRKSSIAGAASLNKTSPIPMQQEDIKYYEVWKDELPDQTLVETKLGKELSLSVEDEISVRVLQTRPHLLIHGKVILESRKPIWRKHSKLKEVDTESLVRSLPDLSQVDSWQLPIDGGSTKGGKKTFEFPQYRTDAICTKCTTGQIDCTRCNGLDTVDCFWCASSGFFKGHECEKCNSSGQINCVKCNNTGKVDCTCCNGKGAIKWALCVDVKVGTLLLPPVTLQDLDMSKEDESNQALIKLKATEAIYQTALQIANGKERSGQLQKIPVSAECRVERHSKRLLHVNHWNPLEPGRMHQAHFIDSTDDDTVTRLTTEEDDAERISNSSRLSLPNSTTSFSALNKVSAIFKRRSSLD